MRSVFVAVIWVGLAASALSQDLSTVVFPSEDELYEALILGEIDYEQYTTLREILFFGIDSSDLHLLDEIPNLSWFGITPPVELDSLSAEQEASFLRSTQPLREYSARVGSRYYRELEEAGRFRNQTSVLLRPGRNLELACRFQRELGGQERIVSRRVTYNPGEGFVRELCLGNYSRRLGLGTTYGYRGKLFHFSRKIDMESFLFPDYGGNNGLYARLVHRNLEWQALASVERDSAFSLVSAGWLMQLRKNALSVGVVAGVNRLKNRITGEGIDDIKYGLTSRLDHGRGHTSLELCGQGGKRTGWGSLVMEGTSDINGSKVEYAGWAYGDKYIDLTSGSKAAGLYHSELIDPVDFKYSDKRIGQEGVLVKARVPVTGRTALISSFLYASRDRDNFDAQALTGVERTVSSRVSLRLDYLNRTFRREVPGDDQVKQRGRLETRIAAGNWRLRSYIALSTETGNRGYLSVFMHVRHESREYGRWDLWSNLARVDPKEEAVNYWYAYVQHSQALSTHVQASAKLGHTYNRSAGKRHLTAVALELEATI